MRTSNVPLRLAVQCNCGDHAFIDLTKGYVALVDVADAQSLSTYCWCAAPDKRTVYAARRARVDGRGRTLRMHQALLPPQPGLQIDHINGCGLDNRRANLRYCTNAQNQWAQHRVRRNAASKFKGVQKQPVGWRASIRKNGELHVLGSFDDEADAARAYDEAAKEMFGQFARVNFPGAHG